MGEIKWGEQLTLDSFINYPDNDSGSWLVDILGENYNGSEIILDSFQKAYSVINDPKYAHIMCSVSGGRDSTVMMHLLSTVDINHKIDFVWFDTGLEYQNMKDHLKYLEERYDRPIIAYKAKKPIPWTCKNVGQPFLSKRVSDEISRLQRYDFKWEDKPYEELIEEYPKCKQALKWLCNKWEGGSKSNFNIAHNSYLREFLFTNPPWFKISNLCCQYAKKDVAHQCYKEGGYDLSIYGTRKAEGGVRAQAYKTCFTDETSKGTTEYRPLHWYSNDDITEFEQRFDIKQSACYSPEWGLKRTGCACCSYGRDFEYELELAKKYEPKLYIAANNIFKDAYEYTRMYREFQKKMKEV